MIKRFKVIVIYFLFIPVLINAQDVSKIFNGSISLGYSHIYNYEQEDIAKISSNLIRVELILTYKKLLMESDYQYFILDNGRKYFFQSSFGFRLNEGGIFPKTYILTSYLVANEFPIEGLIYNQHQQGFGFGAMFDMDLDFMFNGNASFAVTYYPSDKIFYKRMQVGWEIKAIGISVRGIGVRVPDGRYYSGFIFQIRYRW